VTQPQSDEPFLRIGPAEAKALIEKGVQLVDVREPQEYAEMRIAGSVLFPMGTLLKAPRDVLKKGPVLLVCSEGLRSAVACEAAAAIGVEEVYNLEGGLQRWQEKGYTLGHRPCPDRRRRIFSSPASASHGSIASGIRRP